MTHVSVHANGRIGGDVRAGAAHETTLIQSSAGSLCSSLQIIIFNGPTLSPTVFTRAQ